MAPCGCQFTSSRLQGDIYTALFWVSAVLSIHPVHSLESFIEPRIKAVWAAPTICFLGTPFHSVPKAGYKASLQAGSAIRYASPLHELLSIVVLAGNTCNGIAAGAGCHTYCVHQPSVHTAFCVLHLTSFFSKVQYTRCYNLASLSYLHLRSGVYLAHGSTHTYMPRCNPFTVPPSRPAVVLLEPPSGGARYVNSARSSLHCLLRLAEKLYTYLTHKYFFGLNIYLNFVLQKLFLRTQLTKYKTLTAWMTWLPILIQKKNVLNTWQPTDGTKRRYVHTAKTRRCMFSLD